MAICAMTLVGCNDNPEPEPQPQPQAPVVTLEKQSVEANAEGGEFTVNYQRRKQFSGMWIPWKRTSS